MARVKTFTNGGSLLPGDLNSIEDDYEFTFSTYKTIKERSAETVNAAANGTTYAVGNGGAWGSVTAGAGNSSNGPFQAIGTANAVGVWAFYLDPADYSANTRTTKYRLRAQLITNAVAPLGTYTFGLYPVTAFGGASNGSVFINTVGAVVAGSTVAFATPGASNGGAQGNSGDFTAPAAGWYCIAVAVTTASLAANAYLDVHADLQLRQV